MYSYLTKAVHGHQLQVHKNCRNNKENIAFCALKVEPVVPIPPLRCWVSISEPLGC